MTTLKTKSLVVVQVSSWYSRQIERRRAPNSIIVLTSEQTLLFDSKRKIVPFESNQLKFIDLYQQFG